MISLFEFCSNTNLTWPVIVAVFFSIFAWRSMDGTSLQFNGNTLTPFCCFHGRLLFLPDGRKKCIPIVGNENIKCVEPYSESRLRGVTAIEITSKGKI